MVIRMQPSSAISHSRQQKQNKDIEHHTKTNEKVCGRKHETLIGKSSSTKKSLVKSGNKLTNLYAGRSLSRAKDP